MNISVQCQQCGKQFLAPEQMAGKRVRCKQCGNVFAVPSNPVENLEDSGLGALADLAGDTSSATAVGGAAPPRREPGVAAAAAVQSSDDPWAEMNLAGVESSSVRANHPFRYPYSRAVDQYVPFVLVFGGLAWMVLELFNSNTSGRPWIPVVQILLIAIVFILVVLPITTHGVKAGARKARFSLPPMPLWRTVAAFCFPIVLGVILWLVGGTLGNFIVGCLVGLMVSFGAYWLLFRPTPEEIGPAFGFAGGWFIIAVAAGVGVMFALNLLLFTIMSAARSAHEFSASPLGPAFSWKAEVPPAEPAPKSPVHTPTVVTAPPVPSSPDVPVPPVPSDANVTVTSPPAPGAPDSVASTTTPPTAVAPPADPGAMATTPAPADPGAPVAPSVDGGDPSTPKPPAPDLAVASSTATDAGDDGDVPVVGTTPPVQMSSRSPIVDQITDLTEPAAGQAMVTAAAGGPYFAVTKSVDAETDQVSLWNAVEAKLIGAVRFRHDAGAREQYVISPSGNHLARIVAWPRRHIQVWSFVDKRVLEPLDVTGDTGTPSLLGFLGEDAIAVLWERDGRRGLQSINIKTRRIIKQVDLPGYEVTRGNYAISPDGRQIAIAAKMDVHGGGERRGQIQIVDMTMGRAVRRLPINALESRWPVEPAGLAYSPDGAQLAILLENRGDALLVCWRVGDGVVQHEHIFRAGTLVDGGMAPFSGNALTWLDNGNAWLAYGRKVIDTRRGNIIGHIDLASIADQYVIDDDSVALLHVEEGTAEPKVSVANLKLDELAAIRKGKRPSSENNTPSTVEPVEVVP